MKIITTDTAKVLKKDKKKLKKYWELIYNPEYVALMTAITLEQDLTKKASALKDVKLVGTIKQNDKGFVYVKVPDDVIDGLYKMIDEENIQKPPYFGKGDDKIGAHISFISDEELEDKDIKIKEIGQEINFELGPVFSTKPKGWKEMDRVWFVTVKSPEFAEIRKRYGLPSSYKGLKHDFHISVAIRKKK